VGLLIASFSSNMLCLPNNYLDLQMSPSELQTLLKPRQLKKVDN
jgi:hypothetical protein